MLLTVDTDVYEVSDQQVRAMWEFASRARREDSYTLTTDQGTVTLMRHQVFAALHDAADCEANGVISQAERDARSAALGQPMGAWALRSD